MRGQPANNFDTKLRDLIRACQAATADSDSFGELYEHTHQMIRWVLWAEGLDEATREDLLQEVFIDKIFKKIHKIKTGPRSNPIACLRTIARNHLIDYLRHVQAEKVSFIVAFAEDDDADLYDFETRSRRPRLIDAKRVRVRVNRSVAKKALATLSGKEVRAITAVYVQKKTREKAAKSLRWSPKQVKRTVEGLRAKLLTYPGLRGFLGLDAKGKPLPRRRGASDDETD